ncbi:helix-turn-helix domain-containing protein [Cohnella zeiphila]|uniref:Helix-turn-helix transcriptional regulator n=1 Tax=Cohnella zeiphila TaxID=2761120 RepID=A0A7X0VVM2_9BACL|nr:AraC family transcriptional regulator [Cohnella zeiphila]MBB6731560.1 helix-turn-helix transcriptional regulator [Cohnella zeiphila]
MPKPDLAALQPQETLEHLGDFLFPPYITQAHIFNAPEGWGFEGRVLKQYAVNYVIDGAGEFRFGDEVYRVEKGDVFYYGPLELHGLRAVPGQPFLSITVVFHFADAAFPMDRLLGDRRHFGNFFGHRVEGCFSELVAKYRQPGTENRFLSQTLLTTILAELAKRRPDKLETAEEAVRGKNVARLVQAKNFIENRLDRELDTRELERIAGMTWNYLISQFKRTFGITPMQFLIWARVTKAKELALQTPLSFGEIAAQVGYRDIHAFGKMFRKKTGMSLTEFCASVYEKDHHVLWPGNENENPESSR